MGYLNPILGHHEWYNNWVKFSIQYSIIALVTAFNFIGTESVGSVSTLLAQLVMVILFDRKMYIF
jgi:hypothetical protein